MTLEEIKQLIDTVTEAGIDELEVQHGEHRVRIRRTAPVTPGMMPIPQMMAAPAQPPATLATPASAAAEAGTEIVKSPIVGTYYDQPEPNKPPFVKVGDTVQAGQTLCIIESMKLMNEIEAETAGVIVAKLGVNGHAVEYGQPLLEFRPL